MRDETESGLHQPPGVQLMMPPPPKKRRNRPGNPNPDAEVVALSPTTLMATNRFVCEVCNKGFQREQNLQLHRRGHNLPWKLKQKGSTKEAARRKVYLCPEPGCAHHDPGRALGDLTGIKKHYSRKHGEKKYKCDKCAKKYAVQSDRKAHSKTCGTKEYRCDCGTLFSRRDSFITHRAFCDALARESIDPPPPSFSSISTHLLCLDHHHQPPPLSNQDHLLSFGSRGNSQFATFVGSGFRPSLSQDMGPADPHGMLGQNNNKSSTSASASLHGLMQLPQLQINNVNVDPPSSSTSSLYNLGFFPETGQVSNNLFTSAGNLMSMAIPSLYSSTTSNANIETGAAHMSATALLQKAAQLGSTTSNNNNNNNNHHMQDLVGASSASIFGGLYDDDDDEYRRFHAIRSNYNKVAFDDPNLQGHNGNYDDPSGGWLEQGGRRFTRDFLGVGAGIVTNNVVAREQYNAMEMTALDHHSTSTASHSQTHTQHSFGGNLN